MKAAAEVGRMGWMAGLAGRKTGAGGSALSARRDMNLEQQEFPVGASSKHLLWCQQRHLVDKMAIKIDR